MLIIIFYNCSLQYILKLKLKHEYMKPTLWFYSIIYKCCRCLEIFLCPCLPSQNLYAESLKTLKYKYVNNQIKKYSLCHSELSFNYFPLVYLLSMTSKFSSIGQTYFLISSFTNPCLLRHNFFSA